MFGSKDDDDDDFCLQIISKMTVSQNETKVFDIGAWNTAIMLDK